MNIPMIPNISPPMMIAAITQRAGRPVLSPRIFGPMTLPSSCWSANTKIANQKACQKSTMRRMSTQGTAPMKGPKNGIMFVTPTIKLIKREYSKPKMLVPMKQRIPIISESRSFPLMKPLKMRWLSRATRTAPPVNFLPKTA